MGEIVCATRGGQDSQRTQQAAIALAKQRGDKLTFLYVADSRFLDNIAAAVVVDIESELDRMGRFQLTIAQEQAAEEGLDAQIAIRHGHLREELIKVAQELSATSIVLGSPQQETAVFDETDLGDLVADLKADTGAEVLVV
jgi:nucleotide-binding universal stress UspA family protein